MSLDPALMVQVIGRTKREEGLYLTAYLCPAEKWTSGYGFNLQRHGAAQTLESVGLSEQKIWAEISRSMARGLLVDKAGVRHTHHDVMTLAQAETLLGRDIEVCVGDLRGFVPNFDGRPEAVRKALIDMTYNMGIGGVRTFVNTMSVLVEGDYALAAKMLPRSEYGLSRKTAARCARNAALIASAA